MRVFILVRLPLRCSRCRSRPHTEGQLFGSSKKTSIHPDYLENKMSVDIKVLKKHGISSGEYKKLFTMPQKPPRVQKLIDLISNRVKDGYTRNLTDWKNYAAIDLAHDAPFNQTTATFVRHLMSRKLKAEELLAEIEKWGIKEDELFLTVKTKGGETLKVVNPPIFFQVLIPLARSYCAARIATLFNERNRVPLLPYRPLKKTARNRVICEIVTDLINRISTDYGYVNYLDQAIKQTVKYGVALSFPCEEWHCERQLQGEDEEKVTVKEGLRYTFPHPTRMFYDLYHPLPSINSDSGIEFCAYWDVVPFSELLDNRNFWNRRSISYGTNWFDNPLAGNYFNEFYPCRLQFPILGAGADAKRQDKAAIYSTSDRDKAVFITRYYMKLRPRDWDLGRYEDGKLVDTYGHPVWHRFYLAGDSTVIWAEPCAYNPNWFMGYDYDAQAGRQTSLGLETISWQDILGNIITQMLLTSKQNLANVIFYDTNLVNKTDIDELKNLGEARYRSLNFLPYDSMKSGRGGFDPQRAFTPVQLNYRTIQDMMQMMEAVLDIMGRVLQFTAQEVGVTAKHYQSAKEVETTNKSSDSRVNYTGASIDNGIDAWKQQLYTGARAYMDADFESEVSMDIPDVEKVIEELGFTITGRSKDKIFVKGEKHKLELDEFARTGKDDEPQTDQQTAQAMFNTIGIIASHPEIFAPIGAKRVISLLEQAAQMAGADEDFKLPVETPPTGQPVPGQPPQPGAQPTGAPPAPASQPPMSPVQQEIMPLLQQLQQAILKTVEEKIAKPAADEMVKQEKQIQQGAQQIQQIGQLVQQLEVLLSKLAQPPPAPPALPPQMNAPGTPTPVQAALPPDGQMPPPAMIPR